MKQALTTNAIPDSALTVHDGRVVTTSLIVAETFGKQHKHVLDSVRSLLAGLDDEFAQPNFRQCFKINRLANGKREPYYELTRDGFTLLAMGFTGPKALAWKVRYIEAFNAMERALIQQGTPPALEAQVTQLLSRVSQLETELRFYRDEEAARLPVHVAWWERLPIRLLRVDGQAWVLQESLAAVARSVGYQERYPSQPEHRTVLHKAGMREKGFFRTYKIGEVMRAYGVTGLAVQQALGSKSQFVTLVSPLALAQASKKLAGFSQWLWPQLPAVAALGELLPREGRYLPAGGHP